MAKLAIKNLTFSYPGSERNALCNVSLDVQEGEIFLVCGASGCGKSTLLRHMKSCLTPYGVRSGSIEFDGKELSEFSDREQAERIGFVLQHPDDQIVTDKVWHELAFGLESLGTEQETMRLRVGEMASYFGIQNWFYKNVSELSGGQKQLLNLASVMAMSPDLLILDEPTSQLDPIAAAEFLNTLKKLNRELGITIALTEHRLEEAFSMADRVAVMDRGEITVCDTGEGVASKLSVHSDIWGALPTAARVHRSLGLGGVCPLTVRDGRAMLKGLNLNTDSKVEDGSSEEKGDYAIELRDCWFRYDKNGDDILKGTSFKVKHGEIYSLVGGNGTGKSTMLSVIAGVNRPYRGKVLIDGKQKKGYDARNVGIGALCQDPRTLFVKNTVEKDLREIVGTRNGSEVDRKLEKVVSEMELWGLLQYHPFDLSGGEQQRAAIAKLLLTDPDILLLDEPTKGMDSHFKEKFGGLLRELAKSGVAVIIVSHDIEFCAEHSHRCGLFFDGGVIAENTSTAFFCGNNFYTTAANRMSRGIFKNVVLTREVTSLCEKQLQEK